MKPPQPEPTQRLFLALWPDDATRQQLSTHARQWTWPTGCVCYSPSDWHVTLHFIGAVAQTRVAALGAMLALPLEPFELRLDQPQLWPHGLAVLCASEVPEALGALVERLGQGLRSLGLPVETRPYRPHVTLARHAQSALAPLAAKPMVWQARTCALVHSTGDPAQRYRVILPGA